MPVIDPCLIYHYCISVTTWKIGIQSFGWGFRALIQLGA